MLIFFLVGNGRILYFFGLAFLVLGFGRLNFFNVWAGVLLLFVFVIGASFLPKMVSVVSAGTSLLLKLATLWPADGFFSFAARFVSSFVSLCPLVASDLLLFPCFAFSLVLLPSFLDVDVFDDLCYSGKLISFASYFSGLLI